MKLKPIHVVLIGLAAMLVFLWREGTLAWVWRTQLNAPKDRDPPPTPWNTPLAINGGYLGGR